MYWILLAFAILAFLIWACYIHPYKYWKNMGVPQGSPWFLLGDLWPTVVQRKNIIEWMNWIYSIDPKSKFFGYYQYLTPILLVKDPDVIKQLTVKDFDHFTDHNNFGSPEADPLWSNNLFALKGGRWRDVRHLLSGSFTSSKMRIMYGLIREEAEKFADHYKQKNEALYELEMKDSFLKYTTDVIASTSFGITVDSLKNPNNEFYRMGKSVIDPGFITIIKVIGFLLFPRLLKMLKVGMLPKHVSEFFSRLVSQTVKVREEKGIIRPDMLHILLQANKEGRTAEDKEIADDGFAVVKDSIDTTIVTPDRKIVEINDQDIAAQTMIFFFAGFDTVSTAMSFTSYELAVNPQVQDKLRQEINEVSAKTNGAPSYEELLSMKYLDMVLSEALRMWPPVLGTDRICVKPYTLKSSEPKEPSVTFEKDDMLIVPVYCIHHDEKYYQNPEKFIPERFSDENKGDIKPYTYMPFGLGPRACIGSRFALLEIKAMLFYLLRSFQIVPTSKTTIPLKFEKALTFKPKGGFQLGLKRIKQGD